MFVLMAMAWRNLWRNWWRSLLTALAMAMGMALCMWLLAMYAGMFDILREVMIERQVGHVQVHHPDYPGRQGMYDTIPGADEALAAIDALPQTEGVVARMYGTALLGGDARTEGAQLTGVDPVREAEVTALHENVPATWAGGKPGGTWFTEGGEREILIGVGLAEELEVEVGGSVVAVTQDAMGGIGNELYTVVGVLNTGDPFTDDIGAFVRLGDLQALLALDDQIHELRVTTVDHTEDNVTALEQAIEAVLPPLDDEEARPLSVRPWWEVNVMAAQMLGMQGISQGIILFIVFGLAALGVINTMLMSVLERTREIGVMRALGLRPGGIVTLILFEALLLSVVAVGLGLILGGLLDLHILFVGLNFEISEGEGYAAGGMALPPVIYGKLTVGSVLQPALGAAFFAVVAAFWPAWRASRLRPVQAIRQE